MRHLILILVLCLVGTFASGQSANSQAEAGTVIPLHKVSDVLVKSAHGGAMLGPLQCDQDGNVYMRFYEMGAVSKSPLLRITPKGEKYTAASLTGDSEFGDPRSALLAYAVTSESEVYGVAGAKAGFYLLRFDRDGSIKSKTRLDSLMLFSRFIKFPGAEVFLATGRDAPTRQNPDPSKPMTALFDSSGKLLKTLTVSEDAPSVRAAEAGDDEVARAPGRGNLAVERGWAGAGEDGNIYLSRWASPVVVYGISPSGEVVKRFEVSAPFGAKPVVSQVAKNRLALMFRKPEEREALIKIVDLSSGDIVGNYSAAFGSAFTCYSTDPERFTFLASTKDGLRIIYAEP